LNGKIYSRRASARSTIILAANREKIQGGAAYIRHTNKLPPKKPPQATDTGNDANVYMLKTARIPLLHTLPPNG